MFLFALLEIEGDDVHLRAIAAIDLAENDIRTKTPRTEILAPGIAASVPQGAASIGVSAVSADTELSSELSNFPDLGPNVKLITLHMTPSSSASLTVIPVSGLIAVTFYIYFLPLLQTSISSVTINIIAVKIIIISQS